MVLKHWVLDFKKRALQDGIDFAIIGKIHDEVQSEVRGGKPEALKLIEIQQESISYVAQELGFICPLEVEGKPGFNWAECH